MVLETADDWKHLAILSTAQATSGGIAAGAATWYNNGDYQAPAKDIAFYAAFGAGLGFLCSAPGGLIASYVMPYKSVPISKTTQ